ncbi:DUF177 domain-containing protein [Salibacterium salarium]|uniref:DUF177 domain-containing protein n=1 Tax=Salibacterium salarium TaxID=284579 RepID=A0A428MU02_9BACI|nr:YceD family protein [Salibacterium salarium]RSL29611.1 DUF177 domain-containing protein [Salibacterium salarium]
MRWSIQQLLAKNEKGFDVDDTVDVSDIKEHDQEIRDISSVKVTGNAAFTGETVTFHLRLEGSMILPCSRTLADVNFPFDIQMTESFQLDGNPVDEEDIHLHEPENGYVDLLPLIKENILVELPIQIFADGIDENEAPAPQTGKNWEVITEDKAREKKEENKSEVDPRMADLAKFFDK